MAKEHLPLSQHVSKRPRITQEMIEAGVVALRSLPIASDLDEVVATVYRKMWGLSSRCRGKRGDLNAERLRQILHYDPLTGIWTWLVRANNKSAPVGSVAGTPSPKGYIHIGIDGNYYGAHILAWLYVTGSWSLKFIDHKDTIKNNNKWDNLREATRSENGANREVNKNHKVGYKGVSRVWHTNKFQAAVGIGGGKKRYLGVFDTPEEAHAAYVKAAKLRYGEFFRA